MYYLKFACIVSNLFIPFNITTAVHIYIEVCNLSLRLTGRIEFLNKNAYEFHRHITVKSNPNFLNNTEMILTKLIIGYSVNL